LEHLDTDEIRIKRYGSPNEVEATKFLCRKGDIVFGKRRAYLRKVAVTSRDAVVSAHSMVLRPKKRVVSAFLPWFMHSSQFWRTAFAISEGSLSPTIKWKTLSAQEFWLPSAAEQERIAEILWSIESSIERLEHLIQVAERLKKGLLGELLTDGINHKKSEV
jgi:type I restriction enzyme, S subunit